MCVFVFVCCEFFWRVVIPEEEKKNLGAVGPLWRFPIVHLCLK